MRSLQFVFVVILLLGIIGAAGCSSDVSSPTLTTVTLSSAGTPVTMTGVTPVMTSAAGTGPQVGKLAPDFQYTDQDGRVVSLSSLRGKTVVLNFWATWCGPCLSEMPLLQKLSVNEEMAAKGLELLTVNAQESAEAVRAFMKIYGYSFTAVLDPQGAVGDTYNLRYLPTTYFIGPDGVIRYIQPGAFQSQSQLDQILDYVMQ